MNYGHCFGIFLCFLQSFVDNFPVNVLKIDKSFIKDIHQDKSDLELAKAIIAMGKSLNMEVVAEGVENNKQLKILANEGCHQAQGYLLNKPLPLPKLKTTATVSITVDGDGASKQPSNVVQLLSTKKKTLNKKPEPIVDDTVKATDEKPVEKKKAKKQAVTKSSGSRDYTVFNFI